MKTTLLSIVMLLCLVFYTNTQAQTTTTFEFDTQIWVLPEDYHILEFEGKESLLIENDSKNSPHGYFAYLKDYDFSDGIIEFDLFSPQNYPSYVGFLFRLNQSGTENRYELFYFRPFMSGSSGAVQYLPVNNGLVNWSDYTDAIYKSSAKISWNEWIHVKAEVKGPVATVFINDQEVMKVNNLGRGLSGGSVGLILLPDTQKCYYANFKITK